MKYFIALALSLSLSRPESQSIENFRHPQKDAIRRNSGKQEEEVIEHLQSLTENSNYIHRLAIFSEFQDIKRIYGDAASGLSCTMSEIHDSRDGFAS
jgi:hypothetical protein